MKREHESSSTSASGQSSRASKSGGKHRESEPSLTVTAQEQIKEFVTEYALLLVAQSKILARKGGFDVVSQRHVERARNRIIPEETNLRRSKQLSTILGSALFGLSVSEFVDALPQKNSVLGDPTALIIFPLLGLLGVALIVYGVFWEPIK